jgi:vacuolar protein sorting-associated protein VTA1
VITEAQKAAKYAVSALSFEDVHTAVRYLNDALRLLTTPQPPHAAR